MAFRAGDAVDHKPSGETWVLACDEERGRVMPAGWPESMAEASDCELKRSATDDERLDMLKRVSETRSDHGSSYRRSLAHHQLSQLEAKLP